MYQAKNAKHSQDAMIFYFYLLYNQRKLNALDFITDKINNVKTVGNCFL